MYSSHLSRKERQSNLELLRIVAIFMVMILHADFAALGVPGTNVASVTDWILLISKVGIEMCALVAVNVFILISGWFGINTTVKGICKFIFQFIFFFAVTYIFWLSINGFWRFSWTDVGNCIALGTSNWFVKAYIGLMIMAPILNAFCKYTQKKTLLTVLVSFFIYQTLWGWLGKNTSVNDGYSTFSFIGLYLLARFLRLYNYDMQKRNWFLLYISCIVMNSILFLSTKGDVMTLSYANPLNVMGAVGLFRCFEKMSIKKNRIINYIAASSFAVYLLHTSPKIMPDYLTLVRKAWDSDLLILGLLIIVGIMVGFYIVAMIIDVIRVDVWRKLLKVVYASPQPTVN